MLIVLFIHVYFKKNFPPTAHPEASWGSWTAWRRHRPMGLHVWSCFRWGQTTAWHAAYQLMLEEVDYDTKCLSAYLSNVASFELRMQHQKDTWTKQESWQGKRSCQHRLGFEGHMPRKKQNNQYDYVSSFNLPLPICQIGFFLLACPWIGAITCWPSKFDGGTALAMFKEIEDSAEKWLGGLKLRSGVLLWNVSIFWNFLSYPTD